MSPRRPFCPRSQPTEVSSSPSRARTCNANGPAYLISSVGSSVTTTRPGRLDSCASMRGRKFWPRPACGCAEGSMHLTTRSSFKCSTLGTVCPSSVYNPRGTPAVLPCIFGCACTSTEWCSLPFHGCMLRAVHEHDIVFDLGASAENDVFFHDRTIQAGSVDAAHQARSTVTRMACVLWTRLHVFEYVFLEAGDTCHTHAPKRRLGSKRR